MAGYSIGLKGAVDDYYRAHAYREPDVLAALRAETAGLGPSAQMQIAPEQGAFMAILVALMDARRILEIGTFTGYSALAMALGNQRARIVCADINKEWTEIGKKYWQKAGVADRIDLHLDGGNAVIDRLTRSGEAGRFDLVFIDADKPGYLDYYDGALRLLRPGGVVLIDNVLWGGDVADPSVTDADTEAIRVLNSRIIADTRVDLSMLPLADGLTMARKR